MKELTREEILKANDRKREWVKVPEWGGEVCVQEFGGAERDRFESEVFAVDEEGNSRRKDNYRGLLALLSVVDDQGKRLFKEGDLPALMNKSSRALNRVCNVALRLNKLTAVEVEKDEENFESDPGRDLCAS